jgi:hypothetical protein
VRPSARAFSGSFVVADWFVVDFVAVAVWTSNISIPGRYPNARWRAENAHKSLRNAESSSHEPLIPNQVSGIVRTFRKKIFAAISALLTQ